MIVVSSILSIATQEIESRLDGIGDEHILPARAQILEQVLQM